jgi:hypothetical protein
LHQPGWSWSYRGTHNYLRINASMLHLPPTTELFSVRDLAERHPKLLPENRIRWALRNRKDNGLESAGAVFESPIGDYFLHEPAFLSWLLGLSGRAKPRRICNRLRK